MTTRLEVERLSVTYGEGAGHVEALRDVSLSVAKGESFAVIGESGSGKSTLALAIAGLLPRDAAVTGSIRWPDLGRPPRNGADVGFVFQDPSGSLDPVMTVGRQLAEVIETHLGLSRAAAMRRAAELFRQVRLPDPELLLQVYPHQLSGGQKQRVAIAAAIAARPSLLLADEATSALDTIVQAEIALLLAELAKEGSMSILLITHDIALAASLASRIAVLKDGSIVEIGLAADIVTRPQADYTRALVAAVPRLDEIPA